MSNVNVLKRGDKRLTTYVTPDVKVKVEKIANEMGLSVATMMRQALADMIDNYGKK